MNQVANRASSAIASLGNLKAGLQNVASTIHTPGGVAILRMLRDGSWVYGAENVEVEDGSRWAVNIYSLMHGYVSWTDNPGGKANEVVGEVMVPMTTPLPLESDMRDTGWPWSQQLSVELQCLTGADKGETVVYKVTSVGGKNAIKSLVAEVMKQLDADPANPIPVVELTSDHYTHRTYGKTYVPVIDVRSWHELSDEAPDVDDEPEQVEEPKPAPRKRQAAKPEPAKAEPEEEAAEEVTVTAADRKAALLAQIAALEADDVEDAEVEEAPAPDAPRRRRRG